MTMTTYYHATPYENLHSIMEKGLLTRFGELYASTEPQTSLRWICLCKPMASKILVIPFRKDSSEMRLGLDHSPLLTQMLGVEDESASFVSEENIPSENILWKEVLYYDNPFFTEMVTEMVEEEVRKR